MGRRNRSGPGTDAEVAVGRRPADPTAQALLSIKKGPPESLRGALLSIVVGGAKASLINRDLPLGTRDVMNGDQNDPGS